MSETKGASAADPKEKENAASAVVGEGSAHDLEPAPEITQLQAELEQARAEAAENLDRFLRAKAEVENARKRSEAAVAAAHKYGLERFVSEIIPVRDSLELARMVELPAGLEPGRAKDARRPGFDPEAHG